MLPLSQFFFAPPGSYEFSSRMTYVLTILKTKNLLLYCGNVCHILYLWYGSHFLPPFFFCLFLLYDTPRKKVWQSVTPKHFAAEECLINTMSVHWSQKCATNLNSVQMFAAHACQCVKFYINRLSGKRFIVMVLHGQWDGELLSTNGTSYCRLLKYFSAKDGHYQRGKSGTPAKASANEWKVNYIFESTFESALLKEHKEIAVKTNILDQQRFSLRSAAWYIKHMKRQNFWWIRSRKCPQ